MANLIVCCDGTWNTPDDTDAGVAAPTNVVKLHNALAATDAAGAEQKKYYHPGVGTDGTWWNKIAGGGAGEGLDRNIQSAYFWLAKTYRPGDKIYLFGFSRGAYTARSLGGMVTRCGLLDLSDPALPSDTAWDSVDLAFSCYRTKTISADFAKLKIHNRARNDIDPAKTTGIHFIGVWDTVGALGIPDDMAVLNLFDKKDHKFHDTTLNDSVAHARHAVGIDEQRQTFTPTFWTKVEHRADTVKQLWFPGVHSDVGGGYGHVGLSDGALKWMMDEAKDQGLSFRPGGLAQVKPDCLGMLHDSLSGVFKALKTSPRCVPSLADAAFAARFHKSATDRFNDPPIQQAVYWPTVNLRVGESKTVDIFARERWNRTNLFLAEGATYTFSATGEWIDRDIACDADGANDAKFQVSKLLQVAASALGQAETLWRKITGNLQADFWWTKRVENENWFALIGVIASGLGTDDDGNPLPNPTFKIGRQKTYTVKPGDAGYLYCFANDTWQLYANNRGSVSLTVTRTA